MGGDLGSEVPLVQPPPLDRFGLAVNVELKVLTCTVCLAGLAPDEWNGHLKAQHTAAFKSLKTQFPDEYKQLDVTMSGFDFEDPLKVREQIHGRAPVKGIQLHQGFICPVMVNGSACSKVMGTENTFASHLSSTHPGSQKHLTPELRKRYICDYQTIFLGAHRRYFMVRTGTTQGSTAGPYEVFLNTFKSAIPRAAQSVELETRELPSLLRVTRWDVFVAPFRESPDDVVSLVGFPTYQDSTEDQIERFLCSLHLISKAWFAKVHEIWKNASPSIHRLLGMA
jgi:hypothetical protein